MKISSVAERLRNVAFDVDDRAHIHVDTRSCGECGGHPCVRFCPAECFSPNEAGGIEYSYTRCLECGTCLLMCDRDAVRWDYPAGGYGVRYRF